MKNNKSIKDFFQSKIKIMDEKYNNEMVLFPEHRKIFYRGKVANINMELMQFRNRARISILDVSKSTFVKDNDLGVGYIIPSSKVKYAKNIILNNFENKNKNKNKLK